VGFGPSNAVAMTALTEATGDGLCEIGISQYTLRTPDADTDFSVNYGPFDVDDITAVPVAIDPYMTSATATVWVGGGGNVAAGTLTVWFFD
jgi:hypothetical protein